MVVAKMNLLTLGDGDDQTLLGNGLHGSGFGNSHFDAGLQDRSGQHEDDEQHQDHVDKRCDIDFRHGGFGATGLVGERHQRTPMPTPVVRSIMLSSSIEKSSMRAPNSRMRWVNAL